MNNRETLKNLLLDIFLLSEEEFNWHLTRDEIENWDSLGTVSMAVGVQQVFGYHFTPEEAMSIHGFQDLLAILDKKGISMND